MDLSEAAEIQVMMNEYGVDVNCFPDAERRESKSKTITRCMCAITRSVSCAGAVCRSARTMRNIRMRSTSRDAVTKPRSAHSSIKPFLKRLACLCGQCVGVCPTGALKPKREFLLEQGMSPQEISVMNTGRKKTKDLTPGPFPNREGENMNYACKKYC